MDPTPSHETVPYADLAAFNQFVIDHQQAVYSVCLRIIRDYHAAEDATQETFLAAWRARVSLRGPGLTWLLRVAVNKCHDELRRRSRRAVSSLDGALDAGIAEPAGHEPLPEAEVVNSELRSMLELALGCLPGDQRAAVILADCEGLPYRQIALVTGSALGTVKSRVSRGRRRLRGLLAGPFGEQPVAVQNSAPSARLIEPGRDAPGAAAEGSAVASRPEPPPFAYTAERLSAVPISRSRHHS